MRLVDAQSSPLRVVECVEANVPPYVILSHCWGLEEVSLGDLTTNYDEATKKQGFAKIEACVRQAIADGYDYVWIDTCCIDKTSSAELSEAINSMYKWYQNADICYAYLADIPTKWDVVSKSGDGFDHKGRFSDSKWFTRGWTLQELIAPHLVDFFSADWAHLGTKTTFLSQISRTTGVPERILSGTESPSRCSAAERLSWASLRTTTRPEDAAYCLMGLFDIHMPLIYGEGGEKAFSRLQAEILSAVSGDFSLFVRDLWPALAGTNIYYDQDQDMLAQASKDEDHGNDYASLDLDSWNFLSCQPLAASPTEFSNMSKATDDGTTVSSYSDIRLNLELLESVRNPLALTASAIATARGVEIRLPMKNMAHGDEDHRFVFTGCTISGRLLCIGWHRDSKRIGAVHKSSRGSYTAWLLPRKSLRSFEMGTAYFRRLRPPREAATPRVPALRGFTKANDTCVIPLDVKDLQHCNEWKRSHVPENDTVAIEWRAARKGKYYWEGNFKYTAYALPCVTDFGDVFCLFLDENGVAIWPASVRELGLDPEDPKLERIEAVAQAVVEKGKELNETSEIWGEVSPAIEKDVDVIRFEKCAVSATYKQARGGARVVLSSWDIQTGIKSPTAMGETKLLNAT
ncbi:heterokaryon incompatibility protein-domain-containing protein [Podospora aff. communis PSN243]|uniref:Heterokaryon incompatibility protein-domain-containing protein n=1 Tax=Podospora aff. communis PSN243 TaxID=3040156 RepID=A0AAV9GR68_9PEZI|nr:heterokaryon incompatibility protein-domain-containing protein [Podospora aff. communis PSN243]